MFSQSNFVLVWFYFILQYNIWAYSFELRVKLENSSHCFEAKISVISHHDDVFFFSKENLIFTWCGWKKMRLLGIRNEEHVLTSATIYSSEKIKFFKPVCVFGFVENGFEGSETWISTRIYFGLIKGFFKSPASKKIYFSREAYWALNFLVSSLLPRLWKMDIALFCSLLKGIYFALYCLCKY